VPAYQAKSDCRPAMVFSNGACHTRATPGIWHEPLQPCCCYSFLSILMVLTAQELMQEWSSQQLCMLRVMACKRLAARLTSMKHIYVHHFEHTSQLGTILSGFLDVVIVAALMVSNAGESRNRACMAVRKPCESTLNVFYDSTCSQTAKLTHISPGIPTERGQRNCR